MSGDLIPLHAEALVSLVEAGALSGVGLNLPIGLPYDRYAAVGALLGRATTALRFAAGDHSAPHLWASRKVPIVDGTFAPSS